MGERHPYSLFHSYVDRVGHELGGFLAYLAYIGAVRVEDVNLPGKTELVKSVKDSDGTKYQVSNMAQAVRSLTYRLQRALGKLTLQLTKPGTSMVSYKDKEGREHEVLSVVVSDHKTPAEVILHKAGLIPTFDGTSKTGSLCKYLSQPGVPALVVMAKPSRDKGFGDGQAYLHYTQAKKLEAMLKGLANATDQDSLPSKLVSMAEKTLGLLTMAQSQGLPIVKGYASSQYLFGKGNIKFLTDRDWKAIAGETPPEMDGKPVLVGDANWFKVINKDGYQEAMFFLHGSRKAEVKRRKSGLALTERVLAFSYANASAKANLANVLDRLGKGGVSAFVDHSKLQDVGHGIYLPSEIGKVRSNVREALANAIFHTSDRIGYFTIEPCLPSWKLGENEIALNPIWKRQYRRGWAVGWRAPVLGPQALFFGKVKFDSRVAVNGIVFGSNNEDMLADNLGADFDGDGVFLATQNSDLHRVLIKQYWDKSKKAPVAPRLPKSPLGLVGEFEGEVSREQAIVNALIAQKAVGTVDNYLSGLFAQAVSNGVTDPQEIIEATWDGIEATQGIVKMIKKPGLAPEWKVPSSKVMSNAHKLVRGKDVYGADGYAPGIDGDLVTRAFQTISDASSLEQPIRIAVEGSEVSLTPQDKRLRTELVGAYIDEVKALLTPTGYKQGAEAEAQFEKTKARVAKALEEWIKANIKASKPISAEYLVKVILVPNKGGKKDPAWFEAVRFRMLGRVLEGFKYLGPVYRFVGDKHVVTDSVIASQRQRIVDAANLAIARFVYKLGGATGTITVKGKLYRYSLAVNEDRSVEWSIELLCKANGVKVLERVLFTPDSDYIDFGHMLVHYVRRIGGGTDLTILR